MESRVTRTRAKVASNSSTNEAPDAGMAPNLNGNNDGPSIVSEVPTVVESAPEEVKPPPRKRRRTEDEEKSMESRRVSEDEGALDEEEEEEEEDSNAGTDTASTSEVVSPTKQDAVEENKDESLDLSSESTAALEATAQVQPELQPINTGNDSYGKGKRARVPNKRYSDIVINTPTRPMKVDTPRSVKKVSAASPASATKNGDFPEDDLDLILREESEQQNKSVRKTATKSKSKMPDLSKACYRKPFKFGWKREFVHRAIQDVDKPVGDIYYISPHGQKIRSIKELSEVLSRHKDLVIGDFTFCKAAIGINDPTKEIIRDAKRSGQSSADGKNKTASKAMPKLRKRPSSTPIAPAKSTKSAKPGFKVKVPKSFNSKKDKDDGETNAKKSKNNSKPCRPCSIRCADAIGIVPMLQCRICLCLYHHECVGLAKTAPMVSAYVCKNCQLEEASADSGSAAVPPSNLSSPAPLPVTPSAIPNNSLPPQLSPQTDLIPRNPLKHNVNNNECGIGLVGSLTTWFPPMSTIQVGSQAADKTPRRPQLVEFIGNRKYIVVPRHNVLSVRSPAHADVPPTQSALPIEEKGAETEEDGEKVDEEETTPDPTVILPPQEHPIAKSCPLPSSLPTLQGIEESNDSTALFHHSEDQKTETKRSESETRVAKVVVPNFMQNLQYGYTTLIFVFQYLKVQDLLRAGCVCTMWRDISRSLLLWRTVRMKNSQIHSFDGLANALKRQGTVHLDLRKMLLPSNATQDDIWPSFTNAIKNVESLRRLELCRCLASVVEDLARNNHNLEVINALSIKCEQMTFEPLANLVNLTDLRLKSTAGLTLTSDLSALQTLTKLKHLSITSIRDLNKLNIEVIGELVNLEVLDLGECSDFPKNFGPDILSKLEKLGKLRLEKGQGECNTFEILAAVKELKELQQLELVNFDIKTGFDDALGGCTNIRKLLIIPTYVSQSATTNHMVLGGVLRLQKSLVHFVWGVTLELLRVTELFVDQCEQPENEMREKGTSGDSIPVLKPVPLHGIQQTQASVGNDTAQVEILSLPNLQKLLLQNLPTTRVKILKIPFHATWRQSITESGN